MQYHCKKDFPFVMDIFDTRAPLSTSMGIWFLWQVLENLEHWLPQTNTILPPTGAGILVLSVRGEIGKFPYLIFSLVGNQHSHVSSAETGIPLLLASLVTINCPVITVLLPAISILQRGYWVQKWEGLAETCFTMSVLGFQRLLACMSAASKSLVTPVAHSSFMCERV